jgi:hypothetical protein
MAALTEAKCKQQDLLWRNGDVDKDGKKKKKTKSLDFKLNSGWCLLGKVTVRWESS